MEDFMSPYDNRRRSLSSSIIIGGLSASNNSFHNNIRDNDCRFSNNFSYETEENENHMVEKAAATTSNTRRIKNAYVHNYQQQNSADFDSLDECNRRKYSLSGRGESEREVSEITHDNTLRRSDTYDDIEYKNSLYGRNNSVVWQQNDEKSILIKEITETVEIDNDFKTKGGFYQRYDVEDSSLNNGGINHNCENTRVTIVKDVRANISGLDGRVGKSDVGPLRNNTEHYQNRRTEHAYQNNHDINPNDGDGQHPRVDLETLYIVECAQPSVKDVKCYERRQRSVPVVFRRRNDSNDDLAGRLDMDKLYMLNNMLTKEENNTEYNVFEHEITKTYELHEYNNNSICLLMHIGELDGRVKDRLSNAQSTRLTNYESKCDQHIDVIVGSGLQHNFILPINPSNNHHRLRRDDNHIVDESSTVVSINYIHSETHQLLCSEKRHIESLSGPIRAALFEEKAKLGDKRYLSILVVSTNSKYHEVNNGNRDKPVHEVQLPGHRISSHHVVEQHSQLLEELRRKAYYNYYEYELTGDGEPMITRETSQRRINNGNVIKERQFQDVAVQVKPSTCDEAISFTPRSSKNKGSLPDCITTTGQKRKDATTSPFGFEDSLYHNKEDEYAADIYCTNLDLTTKRKHIPGLDDSLIKKVIGNRYSSSAVNDQQLKVEQTRKVDRGVGSYNDNLEKKDNDSTNIGIKQHNINIPIRREVHDNTIIKILRPDPRRQSISINRSDGASTSHKFIRQPVELPGSVNKRPIIVQNKEILIKETLNSLRKSIRQHTRDTYRVQMDNRQRSNSWSFDRDSYPTPRFGDQYTFHQQQRQQQDMCKHDERHVRAKLIPVWNTEEAREYFARIDDYINEKAARCIKRSYSSSYVSHAPRCRIRWVRIPGETIRIDEQRTIDVDNMKNMSYHNGEGNQQRQFTNAECRVLPYELRYWNILHLLNTERQSGKQLGLVFPLPMEDWVLANNFRNGIKQTAQEILSTKYNVKTAEDNALVSFLTYDDNAEQISRKYIDALMRHGRTASSTTNTFNNAIMNVAQPRMVEQQSNKQNYRRVEHIVRYHKLPDRLVAIDDGSTEFQPPQNFQASNTVTQSSYEPNKKYSVPQQSVRTMRDKNQSRSRSSVQLHNNPQQTSTRYQGNNPPVRNPYFVRHQQQYNSSRMHHIPIARKHLPYAVPTTSASIQNQFNIGRQPIYSNNQQINFANQQIMRYRCVQSNMQPRFNVR